MKSKKDWIYVGVMLTESSKRKLINIIKNYVSIQDDWKLINHHSTLCYNNGSDDNNLTYAKLSDVIGSKVELVVTHIGTSSEAIAVRVNHGLATTANIPHITIAIPKSGKPVDSNYITDWRPIPTFKVSGIIDVYQPK